QTEKNVGHHEANFISNKEEGFSPKSHSKYYKNTFLTADENSVPCLLKDSNEDSSSTSTKHMGNMDPLKKDTDILSMEPKDYTEGIPQPKKNREEKHIESATLGIKLQSQATHSRNEDLKATQVSEGYRSMQLHFSNEDIDYFLDLFGKHKLLWIDYYLSNNGIEDEAQNNNYDQAILSDVEQILQYHSEIIYSTKITQADGNTKGEDIQNKSKPLKKLEALLSILRSRYTTGKPDVTVNMNPDVAGVYRVFAVYADKFTITAWEQISMVYSISKWLIIQVVSTLPDDIKPGPDLYGLPWEAVIITSLLGLITILLFICRSYQSIRSRLYVGKERKLGQKVAELLEEKCKVLETLSECNNQYKKLEVALQNGEVSSHALERDNLEVMSRNLERSNAQLQDDIEQLKQDLTAEKTKRSQQEEMLVGMQETLKNLEEEAKDLKSQMEQAQTTLKIYDINSERLQANLQAAKEENALLQESEAQLAQEAEGWGERLSELEEEMKMCESSHRDMVDDCANKDERIKSLTDCLLKMRDWDSEVEDEASGEDNAGRCSAENGDSTDIHQKQKVQKLIFAAKMSADLKSMEEEKNRVFARLTDEVKAKEDLQAGIEKLQNEKDSLQSESAMYTCETQKLQQKLQIMTEMYQENELKLHRMLTVEEKERLQKEEKLTKADKKINLATEELSNYRQRAKELEEELEKTNLAYKNQIASHEKKAHENWLAARAADRDLTHIKRENANLRQKMTDSQFKLEMLEKDPYALDTPGRPLFRGERSPFGPSPLGRPSSENRAFLSPPTLMDGPPRLSPQFPLGPGGRGDLSNQGLSLHHALWHSCCFDNDNFMHVTHAIKASHFIVELEV
ncbi:hypothetical protein JZ751_002987, partial [Albula glossodonta]